MKTKFATEKNNNKKNNKRNKKKPRFSHSLVNAESNIIENNEIGTVSINSQSIDNKWITVLKNDISDEQLIAVFPLVKKDTDLTKLKFKNFGFKIPTSFYSFDLNPKIDTLIQ